MKAFLEHFAAILGAVTAAILAMSWSHEYGYFSTIGRQFQTFLTTGDYITNGSLWLPLHLSIRLVGLTSHRTRYDTHRKQASRSNFVGALFRLGGTHTGVSYLADRLSRGCTCSGSCCPLLVEELEERLWEVFPGRAISACRPRIGPARTAHSYWHVSLRFNERWGRPHSQRSCVLV
jgi:hypothetical protein